MRLLRAIPILLLTLVTGGAAQEQRIALEQAFRDLGSETVVMDLSAHPDDEDGATLAYERMKYGITTYSVLFTRGEGGQNEKGPELYEELGAIRSGETREAGAVLGTQVVFLNFKDFGFSKTASEALRIWGGQTEALRRLVYAIRRYKPDVLFTTHNTIDGHGQHQAVAVTAIAAFDAAADSTMFPEQLRQPGLALWQPRKLFFRVFGRSEGTADVANAINDTDAVRGLSYLDIASAALRKHRTQGMERANLRAFTRGKSPYKLVRVNSLYDQDSTSFLAGIDLWRDAGLRPLRTLRDLVREFRRDMPLDSLLELSSLLEHGADSLAACCASTPLARRLSEHWHDAAARLAMLAGGVRVEARLADSVVVAGQQVDCTVGVDAGRSRAVALRWRFVLPPGWTVAERGGASPRRAGEGNARHFTLTVGDGAMPTLPEVRMQYASLERRQEVEAIVSCAVDGHPLSFRAPVSFEVAPPQTLDIAPAEAVYLRGRAEGPVSVHYRVRNWRPGPVSGSVSVEGPPGWQLPRERFSIASEDSSASGVLSLVPPPGVTPGEYVFRIRTPLCEESARVTVADVRVAPGVRLGIIESYDNTLGSAARELRVPFTMLDDSAIAGGDLGRFSAIVIDIRAYLVRPALQASNRRLLDFAARGGTLLVMYQRDQEWKPEYAPLPFRITRRRVTDENAAMTVLRPDHPLLTTPNRIGPGDWRGWKQERGVYFPGDVPPGYRRLLECADPDEEPLDTGLLETPVGKGAYVYTSLVWYRQLKEAHPGAFRCFANMISYTPGRMP